MPTMSVDSTRESLTFATGVGGIGPLGGVGSLKGTGAVESRLQANNAIAKQVMTAVRREFMDSSD